MDPVLIFLTDMPFWAWFALAGLFLLGELTTGTTFLLWPAISAALLGLITTVQLDGQWVTQWLLFAALTVGLGLFGRPYAERWVNQSETDRPLLNRFAARKVGQRGVVTEAFTAGRGRIRLGDSEWAAKLSDGLGELAEGTPIEVAAMDGTVVIVAPLPQDS